MELSLKVKNLFGKITVGEQALSFIIPTILNEIAELLRRKTNLITFKNGLTLS